MQFLVLAIGLMQQDASVYGVSVFDFFVHVFSVNGVPCILRTLDISNKTRWRWSSWRKLFKEEDQCLFQPVRPLLRLQINLFIIILDPNEASYVLLPYVVQNQLR